METQSIRNIHDEFDGKKNSPLALTEHFLSQIEKSDLNCFITVCKDRALAQAKKYDQILSQDGQVVRKERPLFGIPVAIKDLLTLDGVRTTCASKILENYIPPYTATSVQRLEDAGAIILGKLNMDEFAMGASNENSAFGPVKNPVDKAYVPGGSSGGSAAAVKAGLCVTSLGTDTGGSVRLPASFCGVVGMKPTYGRVSRYGLVAFGSSLDQVGAMGHSVEDVARVMDVISGHDPKDSTSAPVEGGNALASLRTDTDWAKVRVGLPKEYFVDGLSPAVKKAMDASIEWFKKKGCQMVDVSLPHTQYAIATYYLVAVSEASSNLARYDGVRFGPRPKDLPENTDLTKFYKKIRAQFGPEVKRRIILGTFALSSGYYDAYYRKACQVRRLIQKDFMTNFEKCDVMLSPVFPDTAFRLGDRVEDPLKMYLSDIFTAPVSLAGLPAVSVPCGEDEKKLPIGLQLIGPHFREDHLLAIAHAFERGRHE